MNGFFLKIYDRKQYYNFVKNYFFQLLLLSVLTVCSSPLWTGEMIYTNEDLYDVRSGFPFDFLSTDFVMGNDISRGELYKLPQRMSVGVGYTTTIFWHLFFLNIVTVQFAIVCTLGFFYSTLPSANKYFRFLSLKRLSISIAVLVLAYLAIIGSVDLWTTIQAGPGIYAPVDVTAPVSRPIQR